MGENTLWLATAMCLVSLAAPGQEVVVQGQGISRTLAVQDGNLRTVAFRNEIAGRSIRADGPEFVVTAEEDNRRFTSDDFDVVSLEKTADGAVARLRGFDVDVELRYTASDKGPWLYKQITFTNNGTNVIPLRTVEVERLRLQDECVAYAVDPKFPSVADWGQPVYSESLWFGVEFPATRSSALADGTIFLRHHPGLDIATGGGTYAAKRAVVGAAPAGDVQDAFLNYVATLAPRQDPPEAHIYWNGFRVIKPPNRTEQGLKMIEYAKKLKEQTGFVFDGWSYDAGFDMYRADGLFVPNEPEIWDKTREALAPVGTPLGFWTSFSCIYDTPTHAWGKTQGYELQHDASYCLAGPKYYAAIKARLEEIVSTYGMNTINFDGMHQGQGFGCNQPGHGHRVGDGDEAGVYANERVVENKLAIFESLRAINPKIVLDLFVCNEWASPWWLMHLDGVHTVAGDTLGCDIPSPWLRDELITVRDIQVWDEHKRLRRQFPLWGEDLYGTQVRADHLIDNIVVTGESMAERWEDEYVMALVGRGAVSNSIMCSDLGVIDQSRGGLKFLGEVGNWTRRNARLFRDTRLLGGDPARREPFGYAHADGNGRVLVALRNPWIEPRRFNLRLDESIGLAQTGEGVHVCVVYPYRQSFEAKRWGEAVDVPLQDYQVLLLEVRTDARRFEGVPDNARWDVMADGELVVFDAKPMAEPAGRVKAAPGEGFLGLTGRVTAPEGVENVELRFMAQAPMFGAPRPEGDVGILHTNAGEVAGETHTRDRAHGADDCWTLFQVNDPGDHEISTRFHGMGRFNVGAWAVANYRLEGRPTGQKVPAAEELFPVFAADEDRRVATLMSERTAVPGMGPVPGPGTPLAYAFDMLVEQKNGFGEMGWNASGWPVDPKLRIGGKEYGHGLGVHAPARAVFDIGGRFKVFRADVGLHGIPAEHKADKNVFGSCRFIVKGDGKELFASGVRREGDAPLTLAVDVTGVHRLELITDDGGDSNWDDLATWGHARVEP